MAAVHRVWHEYAAKQWSGRATVWITLVAWHICNRFGHSFKQIDYQTEMCGRCGEVRFYKDGDHIKRFTARQWFKRLYMGADKENEF